MSQSEAPYQFELGDTYSVLSLHPLINDGQWGNVSQVGTEILARLETLKAPALIVDLSPLDYMGSAQVALLVRVWKSLKKLHGRMVVQCPGQMVREVLAIAGLKSLWDIVETREAALLSLGLRSEEARARPSQAGPVMAMIALVGVGVAFGLTLKGALNVDARTASMIELAVIVLATVAGVFTALKQRGLWRSVGAAVVVASVIMFAVSLVHMNRHSGSAPAVPAATTDSSASAAPTTPPSTATPEAPGEAAAGETPAKKGGRGALIKEE